MATCSVVEKRKKPWNDGLNSKIYQIRHTHTHTL